MAMQRIQQLEAPPAAPTPVPEPVPKVKVKVSIRNEHVNITSSHPPGHPNQIAHHLFNRRQRDRVLSLADAYGYNLNNCILHTQSQITNEQWASAIAAEIICRLGNAADASVELASICQGGYLAIGQAVYRLTPTEVAPYSRAMRAIHHRTIEKARLESDTLLKQANEQCASILASASSRREEADRLLAEARLAETIQPPRWATDSGTPLRLINGLWEVAFLATIKLLTFEFKFETPRLRTNTPRTTTIKRWAALPQPSIPTLIWVPLTNSTAGEYIQIHIKVDNYFPVLPHVKRSGACMSLSSAPPAITSPDSLTLLRINFERAMTVVECDSIYTSPVYWHANLQATIPAAIRSPLMNGNYSQLALPEAETTEVIPYEDNTTFTAPR